MKEIDANIKAIILSMEGDQDLRERCKQIIEELNGYSDNTKLGGRTGSGDDPST